MKLPGFPVKPGDSVSLSFAVASVADLSSWFCRVVVKAGSTVEEAAAATDLTFDASITSRNADDSAFVGLITRDTTIDWSVGNYILGADLWNPSTGESVEIHHALRVVHPIVPNA